MLAAAEVPVLLVTHDFEEAALLADRVAIVDGGRVLQSGTAAELAAEPASAFVAELTGAVVLSGTARRAGGLTEVELDGGGVVTSTDAAEGPVAVTVHPWEVSLEPRSAGPGASARNRLPVTVTSLTRLGNRVRVGLRRASALRGGPHRAGGQRARAGAGGGGHGGLEGHRDPHRGELARVGAG